MLKIYVDGSKQDVRVWKFPGGEVGVNIGTLPAVCNDVVFEAFLRNSDDIMALVMAVNAFDEQVFKDKTNAKALKAVRLIMSYVPYARQDRVCNPGESLSIAAFARIINSLNFDEVTVDDPHSARTVQYLSNCIEVPQHEIMYQHGEVRRFIAVGNVMLVAPDKGAAVKIRSHFARHPNLHASVIRLDKLRDLATGEVKGLEIQNKTMFARLHNTSLLIVDDICDGGRTFIEAAKLLREVVEPLSISLFVTHGIFSKGKEVLYEAGIDNVWCHNDFG